MTLRALDSRNSAHAWDLTANTSHTPHAHTYTRLTRKNPQSPPSPAAARGPPCVGGGGWLAVVRLRRDPLDARVEPVLDAEQRPELGGEQHGLHGAGRPRRKRLLANAQLWPPLLGPLLGAARPVGKRRLALLLLAAFEWTFERAAAS